MAEYRGKVSKIEGGKLFVEIPRLARGMNFGPLDAVPGNYSVGDRVACVQIENVKEDIVVVGKLAAESVLDGGALIVEKGGTGASSFTANAFIKSGATTTSPLVARTIAQTKSDLGIANLTDVTVVRTTTNQTVGGVKTFSSAPVVPNNSFTTNKIAGLDTALSNLESGKMGGTLTVIPGGADLNTYNTTGYFIQNVNNDAASGSNYPVPYAGFLEVYKSGGFYWQRYSVYATSLQDSVGRIYTRCYYNSTWTPWNKLAVASDNVQTIMPLGNDLNSVTETGVYVQNTTAGATSGANYPINLAGRLEVTRLGDPSDKFIWQRYTVYGTPVVYNRGWFSTSWSPWVRTGTYDDDQMLALIQRAQTNMVGGGQLNGGASGVSWSDRFLTMVGRNSLSPSGYFEVTMPPNGTVIPVYNNGVSSVTVSGGMIPLTNWETLYYEITPGSSSTSDPSKFRIVYYTTGDFTPPNNWLIVCHRQSDVSAGYSHKWGTGQFTSYTYLPRHPYGMRYLNVNAVSEHEVWRTVNFNTADEMDNIDWFSSGTTQHWVIKESGLYTINYSVTWSANTAGNRYTRIMKNSVTVARHGPAYSPTASMLATISGSGTYKMNEGDTLAVLAYQNSGGNLTLSGDGNRGTSCTIVKAN